MRNGQIAAGCCVRDSLTRACDAPARSFAARAVVYGRTRPRARSARSSETTCASTVKLRAARVLRWPPARRYVVEVSFPALAF